MNYFKRAAFYSLLFVTIFGVDYTKAQDTTAVNVNGSFETAIVTSQADTADIEGWTFELQDGAVANFSIVDSVVKDGTRALAVTVNSTGPNQWSVQAINEPFPVVAGDTYSLALWAKSSAAGATANFTVGNPGFDEFGRIGSADVSLTENWQEYTLEFTIPAGNTEGRAPLHFNFAGNVGSTIYIDSLRITPPEPVPPTPPIAEGKVKWLGNVYSNSQAPGFTNYWNQVTPENAGKWGSVEGSRDNMNWTGLDAAYALAKDNELPFRFHVLVWGNQQPAWMKDLSEEDQLAEIREWFEAVAERYPEIDYLEVVNEPLHDPPTDQTNDDGSGGYYEALGGAGETGWDWVITAFEMAREIFPSTTKLMINDYNIVNSQSATTDYIEIINILKERNLIDRIGVQAHAFSNGGNQIQSIVTGESQKAILDRLYNETGLLIMATEMDIDGDFVNSDSENAQIQLEKYQEIFPVYWEHPAVEGVTLWGWRPGLWRNDQEAYIIRENGEEKPALTWLRNYVESKNIILVNEGASSLNPIAKGKEKWLGSVHSPSQLDRFLNYWNQITPENSGKWGSVENTRDSYNWDQLDAAYNLAKTNGLPFRFHVLVWGRQQPLWMRSLPAQEQLEELEEWFEAVAERYPYIDYLEVVNEPINDPPTTTGGNANDAESGGYYEALGGSGETGWDWVINAFQMARDIFPENVKLMINEYGIVNSSSRVQQYREIIGLLKERGLIDRIGVQAHAFNNGSSSSSNTTPGTIKQNLDALSEENLPIQVTELDIDGLENNPGSEQSDDVQLENIKRIFPVLWGHPAVEGVTFWGWRSGMWRSSQDAVLWGFSGRPRPSLLWLEDYVDSASVTLNVSNELLEESPKKFTLSQNYPNPFNPSTQIQYVLPEAIALKINVYDITGRRIKTLFDGFQTAGVYSLTFDGAGLSSGIYFYELNTGNFREIKKMLLVK